MRKMKDSGITWIGAIPEQWKTKRFKNIIIDSIAGEIIDKSYWNDGEELLYTCQKTPMNSCYQGFPMRKRTHGNCLLLTRNATPYIFIPEDNAIFSNVVQKVVLSHDYDRRYIKYAIQLGANEEVVNGDTIPSYNMDVWNNIHFCDISLEEQKKIADYLDVKCSIMDALSSDIQNEITTLENYKISIITEAVTRGLLESVKMKESGISWCPKIPEHWSIIPSKYLFYNSDVRKKENDELLTSSQKYGILTQQEYMELEKAKIVLANQGIDKWKHVEPNDFVISLRSFQGGLEMSHVSGCITWHYIVLRSYKPICYDYYKWLFKSDAYIKALQRTCNFIRDGQDLRYSNFCQVPLFVLPYKEQEEIAAFLDKKCSEINSIIEKKNEQISLLEKYRRSIIYEYTTGKKEVPING